MTQPDVMWITDRQALVFHKGRIWSLCQESASPAWLVYSRDRGQEGLLTVLEKLVSRFAMGGYEAALAWIRNWKADDKKAA